MSHNPVSQRIDYMRSQWMKAFDQPRVQAVRWFAKEDEWNMVEAFFEVESSEHGQLADIFFRMESHFESAVGYGNALLKEWKEKTETDKETIPSLQNEGITVNYSFSENGQTQPYYFFEEIQKLAEGIPSLEGNLVIYLSPEKIKDNKEYVQWIAGALKSNIPEKVKLMLVDSETYKVYTYLSDYFPAQLKTIVPDLQMGKVMRQMATSGNPAAPDVQFRKCIFEMADAAQKKDAGKIEEIGDKAAGIAQRAGWKHLEATARMVAAGHLFSLKKYSRSEQLYNRATGICTEAYKNGDEACGALLTQCYALKGSCLQMQGENQFALDNYILMAQHAQSIGDTLNTMEGWRMAGLTAEKNGMAADSYNYYTNAMNTGKNLDEKVRSASSFLLVGEGIIDAARQSGNSSKIPYLKDEMITQAGPDWEELLQKMKGATN